MVAFSTSSSNPLAACLQPRSGYGGASGLDGVSWVYLGGLSPTQLDISNSSDPARSLPPSIYQVSGCDAPEGRVPLSPWDPRLDNYRQDIQFPVLAQGLVPDLAGAASEPTKLSTYKPFHMVVPVALGDTVVDRMGCNDIKAERSLLERAGWDPGSMTFPQSGPTDYNFSFPSRDDLHTGKVGFKDWPMVSVAVPVESGVDQPGLCPFANGSMAQYPRFPWDPMASFQFPSQHWFRGLLGGYLDGGDLPVSTDPMACGQISVRVPTGKACKSAMDCNTAAGETCPSTLCMAPIPICPQINDLYVAVDEVPVPTSSTAANPIPSPTVVLKDPMDMTKTRTADILAIFGASPGQPGFSPVCKLHFFDKTKVSCAMTDNATVAPRPLCTAQELAAQPTALITTSTTYYVHCLFLQPQTPAQNLLQ